MVDETKKEAETKAAKPTEAKEGAPPVVRRNLKSITSSTVINGVEYLLVPKNAFKYMLFIPPTIELQQRQVKDTLFDKFPVATDWDSLAEFYVNGKETPFMELHLSIKPPYKKDIFGNPMPAMPEVSIVG